VQVAGNVMQSAGGKIILVGNYSVVVTGDVTINGGIDLSNSSGTMEIYGCLTITSNSYLVVAPSLFRAGNSLNFSHVISNCINGVFSSVIPENGSSNNVCVKEIKAKSTITIVFSGCETESSGIPLYVIIILVSVAIIVAIGGAFLSWHFFQSRTGAALKVLHKKY